jgi:hypothetical protein
MLASPIRCIRDGDEVIKRLNFDGESVRISMLALLGMTAGLNALAYGILRIKKRTHQLMEPPSEKKEV